MSDEDGKQLNEITEYQRCPVWRCTPQTNGAHQTTRGHHPVHDPRQLSKYLRSQSIYI